MLKTFLKLAVILGCCVNATAQDLHFSQWFNSPLSTNPANTGFIPDADYRLGANYRNQWSSIMSVPYKTMSIWGDAQVFRDRIESGWLGLGGLLGQSYIYQSIRFGCLSSNAGCSAFVVGGLQCRLVK